jgi:hypothetical protein
MDLFRDIQPNRITMLVTQQPAWPRMARRLRYGGAIVSETQPYNPPNFCANSDFIPRGQDVNTVT